MNRKIYLTTLLVLSLFLRRAHQYRPGYQRRLVWTANDLRFELDHNNQESFDSVIILERLTSSRTRTLASAG